MGLIFSKNDHIVFIGDSITDVGRDRDDPASLGSGYVCIATGMLKAAYPDLGLRFTNVGIGGDTIRDLDRRWQTDVIDLKPDWLSISIGINDVWRLGGDTPEARAGAVPIEEYTTTYRRLLAAAKESTGCQFILMEPGIISQDVNHELNQALKPFVQAVAELAGEFDAVKVPIHQTFMNLLKVSPDYGWTGDGCHPSMEGHAAMAQSCLSAMGA